MSTISKKQSQDYEHYKAGVLKRRKELNIMKKIIKVTKYNEVDPKELKELFELGAKLVKSSNANGVSLKGYVGMYNEKCTAKIPYSDDNIIINNIQLPLSVNGQYDCEITINI